MKIATREAEDFIKAPKPACTAILIYGPDAGLVSERSAALRKAVLDDPNDPMAITELSGDAISADPAQLAIEADTASLLGGRRLIRLRDVDGRAVKIVTDWLKKAQPGGNLVVVEAGDLAKSAALRRNFENAKNAAAIACYADRPADLRRMVIDMLRQNGLTASEDALSHLVDHLAGDRLQARQALEKLVTYMGQSASDGFTPRQITLDDARACVGDAGAVSLDDLCLSAASGNMAGAQKALGRFLKEGAAPVSIYRALNRHFLRLHQARLRVDAGDAPDRALKTLSPPVFWAHERAMTAQLDRWSSTALLDVIRRLADAEAASKRTGAPDQTLCAHLVTQLGLLANHRRSRPR